MKTGSTPSAEEFQGYYNTPDDRTYEGGTYLNSVASPPRLTLKEVKRVSADTYNVIYTYANQREFTTEEVRNYYHLCIVEHLSDRTLIISFLEPEDCTFELIKELRKLVQTQYPLWRIRIGGTTNESTVLIYPKSVRYGTLPIHTNESEAFTTVIEREIIARKRPATKELQRGALMRAFATFIATNSNQLPAVVAAFDNYNGDTSKTTLWTLCSSREIADLDLEYPIDSISGSRYNVKINGDYGQHVGKDAPYWAKEWLFPANQTIALLRFKAYDVKYNSFEIEINASLNTIIL